MRRSRWGRKLTRWIIEWMIHFINVILEAIQKGATLVWQLFKRLLPLRWKKSVARILFGSFMPIDTILYAISEGHTVVGHAFMNEHKRIHIDKATVLKEFKYNGPKQYQMFESHQIILVMKFGLIPQLDGTWKSWGAWFTKSDGEIAGVLIRTNAHVRFMHRERHADGTLTPFRIVEMPHPEIIPDLFISHAAYFGLMMERRLAYFGIIPWSA